MISLNDAYRLMLKRTATPVDRPNFDLLSRQVSRSGRLACATLLCYQ
jgi:hypothetical protein